MPRKSHNKLVRDFIPQTIRKNGELCSVKKLSDPEFASLLLTKITEEASELRDATSRDDILSEYADLMVALDAFTSLQEFSPADIKEAIAKNIERKGLFNERHFLEWTDNTTSS